MKWTEKNYRQKIRQMKEQISDEEIFLSERYQELLRKMSAQITRDHFRNVHIYRDDEPESAGWCDGNMVGINIDNILTQSFYNKELKNKSLVGILGHECGHKNYSNSYLREKYLDGILKEHKFYPHSPVPEAEGEKECLEALKECFQNEEYTVIRLVYKTAAYLNNLLEDVYVEEKMCRQYPGSIRQGIQMNRTRHSDLIISLKKQMEMGRARTEIMLNVITQYTLSRSVNDWEGVGQEYTECLDLCISVINRAVKAVQESARFEATNQILLKIWKFIKADVDDVEKSRQTSQGKEAECECAASKLEEHSDCGEQQSSETPEKSQKEQDSPDSIDSDHQEHNSEDGRAESNQEKKSEGAEQGQPEKSECGEQQDQENGSEKSQEEKSSKGNPEPESRSEDCPAQEPERESTEQSDRQSENKSDESTVDQPERKSDEPTAGQSKTQPGNSKVQASEQPQGFTEDDPERTEQLIDELLSQLSSYSGDYISGQTGGEAQDIPWDGAWNPKKQNEAEDHAASESSSHETSETNSDDGNETTKTSGGDSDETTEISGSHGDKSEEQKSPDCTAVTEPDLEERVQNNQAETENEIGALIYNMAKERVDMQFEEELQKALREQMDQMEFSGEHARVEKCLFRSVEISEEAVSRYKEMEKQMRQVMKRLKAQVLPFLEKRQTRMEKGMPMGRRMDHRTVYRPDRKVFQRRSLPSEEQDTVMAVLIDLSGSMRMDDRINYAIIAALCLYQFGQEAGIPTAVYGHHTDMSWDWKKETVCIHSFAEFDSMDGKDKYRIMDARSCGANRDGVAVRYMGEMLLVRPEKQKLLILISDGLPNGLDYSGIEAKKDLRKIKADLTRRGVLFLAAAIGDDKAAIQDIYEEAFLDISDLKKLPEKLAKQVLKKIS